MIRDLGSEKCERELGRLRWKLFLFVPLLAASLVMIVATLAGAGQPFTVRAAFAAFIVAAFVGIGIPDGEFVPSAPYALLGFVCFLVVRKLMHVFPEAATAAAMIGVAALVMSAVAAYAAEALRIGRSTVICGCLAQAGALAALVGLGSIYLAAPLAALMATGVVCHALEIRRLKSSS